jgi:hypothetical protein
VAGNTGLGDPQDRGDLADAHRLYLQHLENPEAVAVPQRLKYLFESSHLYFFKLLQNRRITEKLSSAPKLAPKALIYISKYSYIVAHRLFLSSLPPIFFRKNIEGFFPVQIPAA